MSLATIFKVCLSLLPFLALCLLNSKINLNITNRGRQFLVPIVALVYSITVMILLDKVNTLILYLIDFLAQYFPFISDCEPQLLTPYFMNFAVIVGFMLIKGILLPFLNKVWSSFKVMSATSGVFYEYEEDIDKWLLQKEYGNFKGYFKGFYFALVFISMLIFAASMLYPSSAFFIAPFYPAFGILLLNELLCYFSGMTKEAFIKDILGEDEESYKVANYGMLRGVLRDLYGSRVLYENTLDTFEGVTETFDALDSMANDEDRMKKTIGAYFKVQKENGVSVDANYVKSCFNLMCGKNTLFVNPFYSDLTDYIMLPLTKSLMSYKKCLIILGCDSATDDVQKWVDEGVRSFMGTNSLWKSAVLDESTTECDIGIIKSSDIYNLKLHHINSEFLHKVGFIILIEPSRILASGQLGLSLLVNKCETPDKNILYCACDRNCDGLVDSLSHALKASITEVTATVSGSANSSQMYWNADGEYMHHRILPNISRYLGVGTEINCVALKYQLNCVNWIGSEKFPVVDMKWIAGQYYKQICNYADMPVSQDYFNNTFVASAALWSYKQRDNAFIVVEDEFQNLFEITRAFASRARKQGFINVISENYLLRDYMIDNARVFTADPKAIPTIVPDYARSERNTVLKLIMQMLYEPISEEHIEKELMLCGIYFESAYDTLKSLIVKHSGVADVSLTVHFKDIVFSHSFDSSVVKYYTIDETNALYNYALKLKNAYYIAEDENGKTNYIGAKLYGHIFQSFLPGQFITLNGKYYEIQTITPLNGVVLRRAADHISARHYYRQLREITLSNWCEDSRMGKKKTVSDIEITYGFADLSIETPGYLDMLSYCDLKHASTVLISGIPQRNYHNKSVLRIKLPNSCAKVRYTICLLLNEIFKTTYPNAYPYITAVISESEYRTENLKHALYGFTCVSQNTAEAENEYLYIIEDSEIDLGLTVSVERNLKRYFEIIADVLSWHTEKMAEKPSEPKQEPAAPEFAQLESEPDFLTKIANFFARLHGEKVTSDETFETVVDSENPDIADSAQNIDNEAEQLTLRSEVLPMDDIAETGETIDFDGEDEELVESSAETNQTEYQKNCFLKFGFDSFDECLDTVGCIEYLSSYGFDHSPLQQVRVGKDAAEDDLTYDPQKFGVHICDFCGIELVGGEYEVLKDGRERCNRCSLTAVRLVDDFTELFKNVLRNMEVFFGIKINTAIKVRMTDAKKVARQVGESFVATAGFDGRTLGFAQKDKTGYSLYIENGAPKLAAIATIAHELTHIWQYLNWDDAALSRKYGKHNMFEIYEGMAKWAEIQYLILLNETSYAKRQEITTRMRDDAYGHGFVKYAEKYMLSYDTVLSHTPFNENPPL